jgi:hypothetical protein
LLYRKPVLIEREDPHRAPVYLRVPPGHAKNWRRYCGKYNACDEHVYFVQDNWYQHEFVPRYQAKKRDQHEGQGRERHDVNKSDNRGNKSP